MPMRFSIVFDLPRGDSFPDQVPARWLRVLSGLRNMWILGNETELVTAFVDYFEGRALRP